MRIPRIGLTATLILSGLVAATGSGAAASTVSPEVTQLDQVGGAGSERFGEAVLVLSNGNYVIVDSRHDDGDVVDVGAVFLFDGETNAVISTLTGSTTDDRVGSDGVVEVGDSNFVVSSRNWDLPDGTANVGAVTWGSGVTGVSGPVSTANSLHGTQVGDNVGSARISALSSGSYLVASPRWNHPDGTGFVGAATMADGDDGITGPVTVTNSLHGTQRGDQVGQVGVTALTNGNFLIRSASWNHPDGTTRVGAVTWSDGTVGITGPVTVTNSLHGSSQNDAVGAIPPQPLANGNFVVVTFRWDHPNGTRDVGAATWGVGSTGISGPVTIDNSLHGARQGDQVGSNITSLRTGH